MCWVKSRAIFAPFYFCASGSCLFHLSKVSLCFFVFWNSIGRHSKHFCLQGASLSLFLRGCSGSLASSSLLGRKVFYQGQQSCWTTRAVIMTFCSSVVSFHAVLGYRIDEQATRLAAAQLWCACCSSYWHA